MTKKYAKDVPVSMNNVVVGKATVSNDGKVAIVFDRSTFAENLIFSAEVGLFVGLSVSFLVEPAQPPPFRGNCPRY